MAGLLSNLFGGGSYQASQATVDPNLERAAQTSQRQASAFSANAPNLQAQQQTQAAESGRQNLAGRMAQNKSSANKRGLLYSGLKQAGDAGAQQQQASQLAKDTVGINSEIDQQANALNGQAINAGFALQQAKQNVMDQNYKNELSQRQARQGAITGLLGSLGGVAGAAAGG